MRAGFRHNDLIRVGVDDEIGVVRHHDHLARRLRGDEERDQLVKDRLRIEVFLGLVDNQRPII